jgi:hypothetical protein
MRPEEIQDYANLEQPLFHLFVILTAMDPEIAETIFFKNTSSQARNAILDKLIRKRYGSPYSLFWNSYLKQLRPIDTKRNEIVHWNMILNVDISDANPMPIYIQTLNPPNFWKKSPSAPAIDDQVNLLHSAVKRVRISLYSFLHAYRSESGDS